ncbi:Magnesium transporter MgtE [bacterium HR25]|nr:Magnesium transporter MgtE [bacterium HR25]
MVPEQDVAGIIQEVEEKLSSNSTDVGEIASLIASVHPADQVDLWERLDPARRETFLALLSAEGLARFLQHLDDEDREELIRRMPRETLARVLDHMETDEAADVIRSLPPADAARVLANMTTAANVTPLLQHEEETAGGIMTRGYIALHPEMTAREAINFLRLRRPAAEEGYYLYVLDETNRLQGVVNLRQLIIADPSTPIAELMTRDAITVAPETDQEETARLLQHYRLRALPVVDKQGVLLGIVTVDDVIDVIEEEATEDIYRLAGVGVREWALSPLRESLRNRIPHLLVNLLTAFLSGFTVSLFEGTIARAATLAVFMPIIAGHGGNTGTQAATVVVRSLALGEVTPADVARIVFKEVRFGLVHGCLAGVLAAGLAFALYQNPWLSGVVYLAMQGNVVVAGIVGATIPLGLRALRIDPALASSIWLTTFTDVMGFLLLLGAGSLLVTRLT